MGKNNFSESYGHEIYFCKNCAEKCINLEDLESVRDWIQFDANTGITYEYTLYVNYQFVSQG